MPIYDYVCDACAGRFEARRSLAEASNATCPVCQGRASRVFTAVPILFKGPGFYVTDYAGGKGNGSGGRKNGDEPAEADGKVKAAA